MAVVNDPSCPSCTETGHLTCGGCKNIKYCSVECQEADWPAHKLLCKSFKDFLERPTPNMRRIIAFLPEDHKPKFMWRSVRRHDEYQNIDSEDFMGTDIVHRAPIFYNALTQKPLKLLMNIGYDDCSFERYTQPNNCVVKATNGRVGYSWAGPIFAECGSSYIGSNEIAQMRDMDTRTFSDVIAYLIDYRNDTPKHSGRKKTNKVLAVKVNCPEEQMSNGVAPFVSVKVPAFHSIFDSKNSISKISAMVGMPVVTTRYKESRRLESTANQAVTFIHCECDPKAECDPSQGKMSFGRAPPFW